jgi:hypothetical protein
LNEIVDYCFKVDGILMKRKKSCKQDHVAQILRSMFTAEVENVNTTTNVSHHFDSAYEGNVNPSHSSTMMQRQPRVVFY